MWWRWGADISIPPALLLPHTQIQTHRSQPKDRRGERPAHLTAACRLNLPTSPTRTRPIKSCVTLNTLLARLAHPCMNDPSSQQKISAFHPQSLFSARKRVRLTKSTFHRRVRTGVNTHTHRHAHPSAALVAVKPVTYDLIRFLHRCLMYQFLSSSPLTNTWVAYKHTRARTHTHAQRGRKTGSVLLEPWHSRGTRKGSILKACCYSDHYGAHHPRASRLYATSLSKECTHPCAHTDAHTHEKPQPTPTQMAHTQAHTRKFSPLSTLYGEVCWEPMFDLKQCDREEETTAISS